MTTKWDRDARGTILPSTFLYYQNHFHKPNQELFFMDFCFFPKMATLLTSVTLD